MITKSNQVEKKNYSPAQIAEVKEKIATMTKDDWLAVKAALFANDELAPNQTTINLALILVALGFENLEDVHSDTATILFDMHNQSILLGMATYNWNWVSKILA